MKYKHIIQFLSEHGFVRASTRGSHVTFEHLNDGRKTTIAMKKPNDPIDIKKLRAVLQKAQINLDG